MMGTEIVAGVVPIVGVTESQFPPSAVEQEEQRVPPKVVMVP